MCFNPNINFNMFSKISIDSYDNKYRKCARMHAFVHPSVRPPPDAHSSHSNPRLADPHKQGYVCNNIKHTLKHPRGTPGVSL